MPKVLPEYLEQRRQQILDAAAACFARRGFHQATMQDICDEAQLSPGALYRYFRSKEEIIVAMCERAYVQDVDTISAATAEQGTQAIFAELIRAFFIEFDTVRAIESCVLIAELTTEAPRNAEIRELLKHTNAERRVPLKGIVSAAQERGEIDPSLDAESVARVMVGVFQGLIMQRLVEPDLDVESYASVLRSMFGGSFWQGAAVTSMDAAMPAALRH